MFREPAAIDRDEIINQLSIENFDEGRLAVDLILMAQAGNDEAILSLIRQGANVNVVIKSTTALIESCRNNKISTIKLLLSLGANLHQEKGLHNTPLIAAIYNATRNDEICNFLMDEGADINMVKSGLTALTASIINNKKNVFNRLLSLNAKITANKSSKDQSPLLTAAKYSGNACEVLLDAGANINEIDSQGSAIMHAMLDDKSMIKVVDLFIRRGINLNLTNDKGETALMVAVKLKEEAIGLLLIASGANYTLLNNFGQSALSIANLRNTKSIRAAIENKMLNKLIDTYQSLEETSPLKRLRL